MWSLSDEDEVAAVLELSEPGCSDRAVAMIATAIVEERLGRALAANLVRDTKTATRISAEFFQPSGQLGSFGSKINFGYLIGIYGEGGYSDLSNVRRIRNDFAHKLKIKTFDDQSIRQRCMNLKIVNTHPYEIPDYYKIEMSNWDTMIARPKDRFLHAVALLAHELSYAASQLREYGDPRF
jgi:DNA-binding MltR family transcriptional regulator